MVVKSKLFFIKAFSILGMGALLPTLAMALTADTTVSISCSKVVEQFASTSYILPASTSTTTSKYYGDMNWSLSYNGLAPAQSYTLDKSKITSGFSGNQLQCAIKPLNKTTAILFKANAPSRFSYCMGTTTGFSCKASPF